MAVALPLCFLRVMQQYHERDSLPILIPYLMPEHLAQAGDYGGWIHGRGRRYLPAVYKDSILDPDGMPDYGGLVFLPLSANKFQRTIRKYDNELYDKEKNAQIEQMNQEYISSRHLPMADLEDKEHSCRRPNWEDYQFPNCNAFHEIELSRPYDGFLARRIGDDQDGESFYLSHGYFRDVLALHQSQFNHSNNAVLKVARYSEHEINYRALNNAKRDALIMERLTGSPNIVDIFGYCGASVMVESLPYEMEEKIVPGSGYASKETLDDSKDVDIKNSFSVPEKLDIALEMAESIAELHGFKDGVIIHDGKKRWKEGL